MNQRNQDVTEAELALLQVLWDDGPATIRQLVERVYKQTGTSVYATVQKLLDRLEAEAGRLACERITPDALAEIQGMHYRMYAHFLRHELPEYFALNQAIHNAILAASGNPVLAATYGSLAGRITRARYMANRMRPDRWKAAMDEHDWILSALVRRDGAALGKLLAQHLQNKRDIILEAIRSQFPLRKIASSRRPQRGLPSH